LGDAAAVFAQILLDTLPKDIIPQFAPEHMEDKPALLVEVTIEQIDGLFVIAADDGSLVRTACFTQVDIEIFSDALFVFVDAAARFTFYMFEIGCKPFVQPGV